MGMVAGAAAPGRLGAGAQGVAAVAGAAWRVAPAALHAAMGVDVDPAVLCRRRRARLERPWLECAARLAGSRANPGLFCLHAGLYCAIQTGGKARRETAPRTSCKRGYMNFT